MEKIVLFWFGRDLRLRDNAGLYHALKSGYKVLPIFIFDKNNMSGLPKKSARLSFIYSNVKLLKDELEKMGSSMIVRYGYPIEVWKRILNNYDVAAVYANHSFEPHDRTEYSELEGLLKGKRVEFKTYKDHVIFEKNEIVKQDGKPYTVFTPYSRNWLKKLESRPATYINKKGKVAPIPYWLKPYNNEKYFDNFLKIKKLGMLELEHMGHEMFGFDIPSVVVPREKIIEYKEMREFPSHDGTSKLGIHFRYGTISVREKARMGLKLSPTYLKALIWRDFYAQILWHFPYVVGQPFKSKYAEIEWRDSPEDFKKWCEGKTGYPLVDAGMRQLNQTGWMHNRLRMLTAGFLTKHLLIDWRKGEAYFAKKLIDYDLASNNGGWQWSAGCGTDASPYFRIFNPITQQKKFDDKLIFIKKWIPEFGTDEYPEPMVDHKLARERCLQIFRTGLGT